MVYDQQTTVKVLSPGLAVVEGFHHLEPPAVERLALEVDMVPAIIVAGTGEPLVEYVQVPEPPAMHKLLVAVNVGVFTVVPLHHRAAVAVVSGVAVAIWVSWTAILSQVEGEAGAPRPAAGVPAR